MQRNADFLLRQAPRFHEIGPADEESTIECEIISAIDHHCFVPIIGKNPAIKDKIPCYVDWKFWLRLAESIVKRSV